MELQTSISCLQLSHWATWNQNCDCFVFFDTLNWKLDVKLLFNELGAALGLFSLLSNFWAVCMAGGILSRELYCYRTEESRSEYEQLCSHHLLNDWLGNDQRTATAVDLVRSANMVPNAKLWAYVSSCVYLCVWEWHFFVWVLCLAAFLCAYSRIAHIYTYWFIFLKM